MSFDFSESGRSAREHIPVPELPLASIRTRTSAARARARLQAVLACAAITLGAIGAGSGVGEKIYTGVRVWLSGGKVAMRMDSFVMVRQPTAADVREVTAHATFPVVFPVGIPAGSQLSLLVGSPAGRPSAIVVSFHDRNGADGPSFVLLDPSVVNASSSGMRAASATVGEGYDWRVGGEVVLAGKRRVSAGDVSRIKAAMAASSPRASLALLDTMVAKIAVLGGPNRLKLAERYAPSTGHSVLLDQAQTRWLVPQLAKSGAPILDHRMLHATFVPYADGQIDYRHVRGTPSKVVAVPPGGVRAIDAVLRTRAGANCGCEVLFNQPNAAAYWVWTIPMSGPEAGVKKYAVDATTFAVTPS